MAESDFIYEELAPYQTSKFNQMTPEAKQIIHHMGYFSAEDAAYGVPSYLPIYTAGWTKRINETADYTDLHNRLMAQYAERAARSQRSLTVEDFVKQMEEGPKLSRAELRRKKIEWINAQGHKHFDPNARDWSWKRLFEVYGPAASASDDLEIPIWREMSSYHYQNRPQQAISTYLEARKTGEPITFFDLETFGTFDKALSVDQYFIPYQATFTSSALNEDGTVKAIGQSDTLLINPKTSKQWKKIEQTIEAVERAAREGNPVQLTDAQYRTMRDLIKYSEAQFDDAGKLIGLTGWVDEQIPEQAAVDLTQYVADIKQGLAVLEERGTSIEELVNRYNETVLQGGIVGGQNVINYDIQAMSVVAQTEGLGEVSTPSRVLDTLQLNRSVFDNPVEQIYGGNVPEHGLLAQDSFRELFELESAGLAHTSQVDVEENIQILGLMNTRIDARLDVMRSGEGYFAFDETPLKRGDYLFAEFGQQRYGEAAPDIIYEETSQGLVKQEYPRNSVTRKTFYQIEDVFTTEGRSNLVLRNQYTDQLHAITRDSDESLQSYVQQMFRYVGDTVDPNEMLTIKEHYEKDLARQRYRNFFRQEGGFRQAKLFYNALDIETEEELAQHFRSKQQLRDFRNLRARLKSEAEIVKPALEQVEKHFQGDYRKTNQAMIILGELLDQELGVHQEEIAPLAFEGFSVEFPTTRGELARVQIPNLQRGADNIWWAVYNQTRGQKPAAQQSYMIDVLDRLVRQDIITKAEREEVARLKTQGVRYQTQQLAEVLMRHQPELEQAKMLAEALTPRDITVSTDDLAKKGLDMAEHAIGVVNKLDWDGKQVRQTLADISESASQTLPLDFKYDIRKNIDDIVSKLSTGSKTYDLEGAGVVFSLKDDGRILMAVSKREHAQRVEASLLRGKPAKNAAYIELPIPDKNGIIHFRSSNKAALGVIRHGGKDKPFHVEFHNVMDEVVESLEGTKWNILQALDEGNIDEVQRQLNRSVNTVIAKLPDISRGVTSQGTRYLTQRDIVKQGYLKTSGLVPRIARDLKLHEDKRYIQSGATKKGYLAFEDLTQEHSMQVIEQIPKYLNELFGLEVNTASIKGEHLGDLMFSTRDVRRHRALGWYTSTTRPNFLQVGGAYQLEESAVESIRRSNRLSLSPGLVSADERKLVAQYDMAPSRVSMNVALVSDDILKRYYVMSGKTPNPIEFATTYENTALLRRSEMSIFDAYHLKSISVPDVLPDEITFSDAILKAQSGEETVLSHGDLIAEYMTRSGELRPIRYDEHTPGIIDIVDLTPGSERIDIRVAMPAKTGSKVDLGGEKATLKVISDEMMDEIAGQDVSMLYSSNIVKHKDFEALMTGQINKALWHIEGLPEGVKSEAKERFIEHFNRVSGLNLTADAWVDYFGESGFEVPSDPELWKGHNIKAEDITALLERFGINETRTLMTGDEVVTQRISVGRTIVDEHLHLRPALGSPLSWQKQDVGVKFGPRQTLAIEEDWGWTNTAKYIHDMAAPDYGQVRGAWDAMVYALDGTPEGVEIRRPYQLRAIHRGYTGYTEDMLEKSVLMPEDGTGTWLQIPEITVDLGGGKDRTLTEVYMPFRELGHKSTGEIELDDLQQQMVGIHNLALEYGEWLREPDQRQLRTPSGANLKRPRAGTVIKGDLTKTVEKYYHMLDQQLTAKQGDLAIAQTVRMPASGHGRLRIISPEVPRVQTVFTEQDWAEILGADEGEHYRLYRQKLQGYQKQLGQEILEEGTQYISPEYGLRLATDPLTGFVDEELLERLYGEGVYGIGVRYPIFFHEAAQDVKYKISDYAEGANIYITPGIADIQQGDTDGDIVGAMLAYHKEFTKDKGWQRTADSLAAEEELRKAWQSKESLYLRSGYADSAAKNYQKKYARFDHILYGSENIEGLKRQGLAELASNLTPGASTSTIGAVHIDPTWGRHIDIETPTIAISKARAKMLGIEDATGPIIGVASAGGAPGRQLSAVQLMIDKGLYDTNMRVSDVAATMLGVDDGNKVVIGVSHIGQDAASDEFARYYASQAGQTELEAAKQLSMYGSSARLAADVNEGIKQAASRLEERRSLSRPSVLNERLQTLINLAPLDDNAFGAFIGPTTDAEIMHAKLGKMGIGYLSNINMQMRQLTHAVQETNPEVFERVMEGIDDPIKQLDEFRRVLEQEFIDVKHGEINLASRRAPHESIEVGRALKRGDFDFIRRITKQTGTDNIEQVFTESSIEATERLHDLLESSGQWNSHVSKLFLSEQFDRYAGGAAGFVDMVRHKDDQLITPYFGQVLDALGEEQPDLEKQARRLARIVPDSIGSSMPRQTVGATVDDASRKAIREGIEEAPRQIISEGIEDAAVSTMRSGIGAMKTAGLVGAALVGSYLVASFFRRDPLQPERQPVADMAPDVTGTYDPNAEPATVPIFDEYTIARQAPPPQLGPSNPGRIVPTMQGPQTAYITPNTGYNVNIRARGNVPKERVAALTQQALQQGAQVPVTMNLNFNDNTQNINRLWMQEQIARAIQQGYNY